jgi:hypothetical protein
MKKSLRTAAAAAVGIGFIFAAPTAQAVPSSCGALRASLDQLAAMGSTPSPGMEAQYAQYCAAPQAAPHSQRPVPVSLDLIPCVSLKACAMRPAGQQVHRLRHRHHLLRQHHSRRRHPSQASPRPPWWLQQPARTRVAPSPRPTPRRHTPQPATTVRLL